MSAPFYKIHRNLLLITLWELILAKCFILEYCVQIYAVPINSALYVWTLSITMAAAATFVFLRLHAQQRHGQASARRIMTTWGLCGAGGLMILAAGFLLQRVPPFTIPAGLAVCIGLGYASHGRGAKNPVYIWSAIGWWIGAAILFAQNSVLNLLIFGLLILAFSVSPSVLLMLRHRHRPKAT